MLRCRALVFKGQLYVSYAVEIFDASLPLQNDTKSTEFKMRFQGTGIARVNMQHEHQLHNVAMFAKPLIPRRVFPCCDKNWGMLELEGLLYIFYTILPTLTVFTVDLESPADPVLVHASYISNDDASWLQQQTGLKMQDVRISGHPIILAEDPTTLLIIVHHNWRKHNGSKHWAVQMQIEAATNTFVISAVSSQPILDHGSFILHNDNEDVMNVVAIGSYHEHQGHLRMLFGDGDKYAAYHDVCLSSIMWINLNKNLSSTWTDGLSVELGDKVDSITHAEYTSMVW